MSTKKKKPIRKAVPRTVFDVALERASAQLEKYVAERTANLMRLDFLAREIPRLENIVAALSPQSEPVNPIPATAAPRYAPSPEPAAPVMDQEEYLAKFIPRAGRVTTAAPPTLPHPDPYAPQPRQPQSDDPDEFLRDDGHGMEILS